MSNETKWLYAAEVVLEASGASAANAAYVAANDAALSAANHFDYPLGDFSVLCSFGANIATLTGTLDLYRQDLDFYGGTGDANAPSANYKYLYVGSFFLPSGQSAAAYYPLTDVPLGHSCQFTILNNSGQNFIVGWSLRVVPKTYAPVA